MNAKRGHESTLHLETKIRIGELLRSQGHSIFYEYRDCDILVVSPSTKRTVAIEVESSPRNVSRNIQRNSANGIHAIAICCLKHCAYRQISRKARTTEFQPLAIFRFDEDESLLRWVIHQLNTPNQQNHANY